MLAALAATGCGARPPDCLDLAAPAAPVAVAQSSASADTVVRVRDPDSTRIVLNIPAFAVTLLAGDSVLRSYPVAVGSPRYPTRTGSFTIRTITWNPWWVPPASDWARGEKVTPPGPANPMGKVKINYTSAYYLHGTPDSTRLRRAVSHGCVRMQNRDAIDLALVLQERAGALIESPELQQLLDSWKEYREVRLETAVPIEVRYQLAEVRDTLLIVHHDIYQRVPSLEQAVLDALSTAGLAAAAIDSGAVRTFARGARDGAMTSVSRVTHTR